jgi:hypothetical protein
LNSIFKVIIAGSRTFTDYDLLVESCDKLLTNKHPNVEIVNGGASGADRLGGRYAIQKGYKMKHFPADWERFGRSSGFIRNKEMAEYADAAIVFWDGVSKGSKHMIDLAQKQGLTTKVVRY